MHNHNRSMKKHAMSTCLTSIRRWNSTFNLNQIGLNTLIIAWLLTFSFPLSKCWHPPTSNKLTLWNFRFLILSTAKKTRTSWRKLRVNMKLIKGKSTRSSLKLRRRLLKTWTLRLSSIGSISFRRHFTFAKLTNRFNITMSRIIPDNNLLWHHNIRISIILVKGISTKWRDLIMINSNSKCNFKAIGLPTWILRIKQEILKIINL